MAILVYTRQQWEDAIAQGTVKITTYRNRSWKNSGYCLFNDIHCEFKPVDYYCSPTPAEAEQILIVPTQSYWRKRPHTP